MLTRWFSISWWTYLFKDCTGIRNFFCRINGHKSGVVWYTCNGEEPDMTCKNCGEDLG